MQQEYELMLKKAIQFAEQIYDKIVRRWGNVNYARSSIYDWVWSEDFEVFSQCLSERERGAMRMQILSHFQVKPWPWYPSSRLHYDEY